MLIKGITLNNFRQYKGNQKIEFAINQPRNVTVVKGENGAGKTTLLQAFLWCFYQKLDLPRTEKIYNTELFNSLDQFEKIEVWVEVEFIHNNEEYYIRRETDYCKIDNTEAKRTGNPVCRIKKKTRNGELKDLDPKEIERKIPEDLSTYFFFDGERIENISKSNNKGKKDISKAVKNLLGMDILWNAQEQLRRVSKLFEKEYKSDKSEEINSINDELDNLRDSKGKCSIEVTTIEKEIEILQEKISVLNQKMKDNSDIASLQKEREEFERKICEYDSKIKALKDDIQKNNKRGLPDFLANKLLNLCCDKVDLSKIETKGIVGIDGSAIDYILERGECICGQKIGKGSEEYNRLINQKEYQPPASLGTIMTQFNEKKATVSETGIEFYKEFKKKYFSIEETKEYIEIAKGEIEEISEKLQGTEDVRELEKDRNRYINDREDLRNKLIEVKARIGSLETLVTEKETELANLALADERNKVIELRKRYCDELSKIIQDKYNEKEKIIQEQLNRKVSKLFNELIDTKHSIQLNDDYTFKVVDVDGEDSTSQGQDVITSFAFIGGLIDIAREKHKDIEQNEPYPLIMDAPFAKLSKVHRRNVARIIPNITEQFILFSVDSQYEGDIEENLRDKIGKQYELIMHDENEKYTEIREV